LLAARHAPAFAAGSANEALKFDEAVAELRQNVRVARSEMIKRHAFKNNLAPEYSTEYFRSEMALEKKMRQRMVYNEHSLLSKPPLLMTESEVEFESLRTALEQEIKPRGIIEQMYVADICHLIWESLRLHRNKAIIINIAYRAALEDILTQL
jgi:hypothetical protein